MIDGPDGLAGGFAAILLSVLLMPAVGSYALNVVLLCLVLGCVLAFLLFNLRFPWQPRARIFLEDGGSAVLGYSLVWFVIQASRGPRAIIQPITAVWLFGLPIADTAYLMMSRMAAGRSPLHADRCHLHHLLQRIGLPLDGRYIYGSQRHAVLWVPASGVAPPAGRRWRVVCCLWLCCFLLRGGGIDMAASGWVEATLQN